MGKHNKTSQICRCVQSVNRFNKKNINKSLHETSKIGWNSKTGNNSNWLNRYLKLPKRQRYPKDTKRSKV